MLQDYPRVMLCNTVKNYKNDWTLALTHDFEIPTKNVVLFQIKKTSEATLTTIQDMVTIEDYDVSECFHHSRSTESVKSTVSETYLSKPSIAKRRANQQETEQFYFMVNFASLRFTSIFNSIGHFI